MVQKYLKYTVETTTTQRRDFINLAKDLSAMNRQLFRQARMYKVKSITIIDDDEAKYIQLGTAPTTWAMKNSVTRAYRRWNEMNNQVLNDQPGLKARWNDFKPYLSLTHKTAEDNGAPSLFKMLTPRDIENNELEYGEWDFSMFESPDGTSSVDGYKVGILGGHDGEPGDYVYVGLIQSYGDARGTVNTQQPNINVAAASDDPLVNLLDAGTQFDEIAENIVGEGDAPPYKMSSAPGEEYVGASGNLPQEVQFAELNSSGTVDGIQRIYNVDVPLGVIRLDHQTESGTTNFTVIVELAEGKYKGIHSESMV